MIEARGIVVATEAQSALVTTDDNPVCARCAAAGGCGAVKLTRALCLRPRHYRVRNPIGAVPGDHVVIGVEEGALWKSSLVVYLVPLLLLLGGAMMGSLGASDLAGRDTFAALGGLAGAALSVVWLGVANRRFGVCRFEPIILKSEGGLVPARR